MALSNNSNPGASSNGTYRQQLVDSMVFELIPLKSVDAAIQALPPNSPVSVTASPVKGLDATKELTDRIRNEGHPPGPHIAGRPVEGPEHVQRLTKWLKT